MVIWAFWHLVIRVFEHSFGHLDMWLFGQLGHLGFWHWCILVFGHLDIFGHLAIWAF